MRSLHLAAAASGWGSGIGESLDVGPLLAANGLYMHVERVAAAVRGTIKWMETDGDHQI